MIVTGGLVREMASSLGLSVQLRADHKPLWDETMGRTSYQPVAYTNASLDYQLAYQRGHGGDWQDLSLIISWDNRPTALWPLSLSFRNGEAMLTSQGLPVLPPLFVSDCPKISRKRIVKICLDIAHAISVTGKIRIWESGEPFTDLPGMSEWHIESMARASVCTLHHDLYLDLRPELAEIRGNFRKSYKALIVSGSKLWDVGVLASEDECIWQAFRNLHQKVAGRVTRSEETWALQLQDIASRRAFLVWLRNGEGQMVGGGLFNVSGVEGVYAVGAYDRTLFDKPLGHVVQYRAMTELKERGVSWYKLGARFFGTEDPTPTDKEISISEFKQGFASHVFPHYRIKHPVVLPEET